MLLWVGGLFAFVFVFGCVYILVCFMFVCLFLFVFVFCKWLLWLGSGGILPINTLKMEGFKHEFLTAQSQKVSFMNNKILTF